ncbi:serine hydrolase domain-containing protein [Flavobacterium sp. T12S277]|uniref:serine hydrolase domain-containing protein n=1 Tax=Flavobacterium sp. T12S277 TaxID=3402752 RepID=UPI003ADD06F7
MNTIRKISTLLCFLLLFSNCNLVAQKKDKLSSQIDSILKKASPVFNGVVLISKKGKTIYSKAQGFENFETKKPLTLNSHFEIMSNSKQITAVLILLEVEKGKINLNAPIKKYLPDLTQSWADSVTVQQLLNHSHGITSLQKPLAFPPGTDFKYGDLSFSLLGKIVANTTKKSYSENANLLFKKLKMKNTFVYDAAKNQNIVLGYLNKNGVFESMKNSKITPESLGADGIVSTVNDLALWNENLHKGKILQPKTYPLMITSKITSQHNFFGKEKEGYGSGIRIIQKETVKYLGHTGLGDGFSSVNLYFPESETTVIILENQMNTEPNLFYASEFKIKNAVLNSNLLNP